MSSRKLSTKRSPKKHSGTKGTNSKTTTDTPTILSLFKKQRELAVDTLRNAENSGSATKGEHSDSTSKKDNSDDDVKITKVEVQSDYFAKKKSRQNLDDPDFAIVSSEKRRKLSLRKRLTVSGTSFGSNTTSPYNLRKSKSDTGVGSLSNPSRSRIEHVDVLATGSSAEPGGDGPSQLFQEVAFEPSESQGENVTENRITLSVESVDTTSSQKENTVNKMELCEVGGKEEQVEGKHRKKLSLWKRKLSGEANESGGKRHVRDRSDSVSGDRGIGCSVDDSKEWGVSLPPIKICEQASKHSSTTANVPLIEVMEEGSAQEKKGHDSSASETLASDKTENNYLSVDNVEVPDKSPLCEDVSDGDLSHDHAKVSTDPRLEKNALDSVPSTSKEDMKLVNDDIKPSTSEEALSSVETSGMEGVVDTEPEFVIDPQTGKRVYRIPYYLENFRTILKGVLEEEDNLKLFSDTDMKYVTAFNNLSENGQKLYARLFGRKLSWLPMSKVKYPEISEDLTDFVTELVNAELLLSGESLNDLEKILKVLSAPDLKSIAKSFHINTSGVTKQQLALALLKKSKQSSIGAMFHGGAANSAEKAMIKRAKGYLGSSCKLVEEPRAVFIRVLMLFSLSNTNYDEESGSGGQHQVFQMLMANIGRVVYPKYKVNRQIPIFQCRQDLIRFEVALQHELDLHTILDKGNYTMAHEFYTEILNTSEPLFADKTIQQWDEKLPSFLRTYTAVSVYTRIHNQGVEILQRLKKYSEAVELLQRLLAQTVHCCDYRGHWWDRLALNLDAHLKSPSKALNAVKEGLSDPHVKTGHRLALYQRAEKLCTSANSKFKKRMADFHHDDVIEAPKHYVYGKVLPDAGQMGLKHQFMLEGEDDTVTMCAVEELALEHYKNNGYPEGIHAEGSTVSSLFILFFWDLLFMDVPNVFFSPFQTGPLDSGTQHFYLNRKDHVEERLSWIKQASEEELSEEVAHVWEENTGTMVAGINWDKFATPKPLQNLVQCMGGHVIGGILERYIQNPRHTRGGFPDLTLWNITNKTVKISEVKGPGDRLSHKQILWLDYLLKLGVDAEVCYVKAVGAKKLTPTTCTIQS